jgi:aryl-alcohol dehydrogenase-like predicted oxidoreductase
VLADQAVSSAVIGTTRLSHLKEDIAASGLALPNEVMARIQAAQVRHI